MKNILKRLWDDKYTRILLLILFIALFLRLQTFAANVNQSYWWDESTYLNTARYWAFGEPHWDVEPLRPPLFMFLLTIFFKLGFNETFTRFFVLVIPSVLLVLITYLLTKELFDKKTGLIAATITAVAWDILFNTTRVHTDVPYTLAIIAAIYFFYKGYIKEKTAAMYWAGILFGVAYSIRETAVTFLPAILIFILIHERANIKKIVTNKTLWKFAIITILTATPYFIYGQIQYETPTPWLQGRVTGITQYEDTPITLSCTMMLQTYVEWFWFIFMIAGTILLCKYFVVIDKIVKGQEKRFTNEIFITTIFIVTLLLFTFVNKTCAEPRWIMPIAVLGFIVTAYGINYLYEKIKLLNAYAAIIIVIAILTFGAYQNITHNNELVSIKQSSFSQLADAGKIIQQDTNKDAIIYALTAQAEAQYLTKRKVKGFHGATEQEFQEQFQKDKPPYVIVSLYVPIDPNEYWKIVYPFQHPETFTLIKAYQPTVDQEGKIPIVTLFKVKYE